MKTNSTILALTLCLSFSTKSYTNSIDKKEALGLELAPEAAILIEGKYLTLSEAIKRALELNPDIYIEKYNIAMSDTETQKFDAQYSSMLNLSLSRSSDEYPSLLWTKNGKKIESNKISGSLAKHFSSGTTVATGLSHSDVSLNPGTTPRTFDVTNPVAFISVEQELLKNIFGYSERRYKEILNNASLAQKEARLFSISMITLGIITDYWRLAIVSNQLDNARLMLSETNNVKKITAKKVSLGLSEKFEINYWNSRESLSNTRVLQAKQSYNDTLKKFLRDINSEIKIGSDEKVVLTDTLPIIDIDYAVSSALKKRPDYRNAQRELAIAKLETEIYKNGALPSLKGFLTASSMDFNPESQSKAYSNLSARQYASYSFGLNLSYPLDNTLNKTDQRNAMWKVKQAEKKIEASEIKVRDEVTSKVENIKTTYEIYNNAKTARNEAEEFYKKMLASFQNGRFNASTVRDAIDGMINAREAELQSLVAFNIALLEFAVSKNELFETFKIDIEKYIKVSP